MVAVQYLLHKQQVLMYEPVKDSPQIIFTLPRQHENKLPIDQQFLKQRKQLAESKAKSVNEYLQNKAQCRTQILLEYFGEQKEERCLVCDFCVEEKNKYHQDEEFVKMRSAILNELVQSEMEVEQVTQQLPKFHSSKIIETIRVMIDFGDIKYNSLGNLTAER